MNEDNIAESIDEFLENHDAENETVIRMDDDTELFINHTDDEDEDDVKFQFLKYKFIVNFKFIIIFIIFQL